MSDFLLIFYMAISLIPFMVLFLNEHYFFQKYQTKLYFILITISLIPKFYFLFTESYYLQGLYDIPGHIDYIKYIVSNLSLPKPYDCWECFQQPFYYLSAIPFYKLGNIFGLQLYSLIIYYSFIFVSILIFTHVLNKKHALIASCLILFWPSGSIHSARVGNEVLLYLVVSISLYFLIVWWKTSDKNLLIKSIFFMLLGILIKTSALIMLPVIFITYLIKNGLSKKIFYFSVILFLAVAFTMIINQRYLFFGNKQDNWLVGNWSGIPKSSYIGNKLENFTNFDVLAYIQHPNINPSRDEGGRQFFWNYFIKTSLFGELTIYHPIQQKLAKIISIIMLVLITYLIIGIFNTKKLYIPLLLTLLIFLVAAIIYRIVFPCPCTNDFRFVYPVVVPILFFISLSDKFFNKNLTFKYIFLFSIGFFISLAFLFHIIPSII